MAGSACQKVPPDLKMAQSIKKSSAIEAVERCKNNSCLRLMHGLCGLKWLETCAAYVGEARQGAPRGIFEKGKTLEFRGLHKAVFLGD